MHCPYHNFCLESREIKVIGTVQSSWYITSIGGDGLADSLRHSAKLGSYGIIDLNTNKVLHIELVQVY